MPDPLTLQPFVTYLAGLVASHVPSHITIDELISAGTEGLIDASEKFDPERDVEFKVYAEHRIKGAILDELRGMDYVSRGIRAQLNLVENAFDTASARLKRPAEQSEVAEELGISLEKYYKLLVRIQACKTVSFDNPITFNTEDGPEEIDNSNHLDTFTDFRTPASYLEEKEEHRALHDVIATLPQRTQEIIWLRYWEENTLKEIGEVFELTESRMGQVLEKAHEIIEKRLNGRYRKK